jgi:hypothetical protein
VAVERIERLELLAIVGQIEAAIGHHAIDVEDGEFDFFCVFESFHDFIEFFKD